VGISGAHLILFSRDAEATRAWLRDVLELDSVDAGGGWLIFALPPAEVAVHPADASRDELYLMCDDIEATVAELGAKGAELEGGIADERFGRVAHLRVPGIDRLGIYQPSHPSPLDR
jgi:catechol 2,3-dioxygenase-like lactoylglutathione lyase family enzyme